MGAWLEVGSRVRVRKVAQYGAARTFEGMVTGCWDFLAVEADGKTEHVMPDEVVEVLAPPPTTDPAVTPSPAKTSPSRMPQDARSEGGTAESTSRAFQPRYPGDSCQDEMVPRQGPDRDPPRLCPACGRMSSRGHRAHCTGLPLASDVSYRYRGKTRRGPQAKTLSTSGLVYPRCDTCGRSIVRGRHRCRPLKRSHRHPELTDSLPSSPTSTPPTTIDRLPFPAEGVEFSCKVSSELNLSRWHWRGRRARSKEQRVAVYNALGPYEPPSLPVEVTITRTGWNMLDEHDNLRLACKSVVDAIAEWLGVDDRSSLVTWLYAQNVTRETEVVATRKGPVRQAVNRIRIAVRTRVTSG